MKNLSTSFENVSTITENMNISNVAENNYFTVTGASNITGLSDGCVSKLRRNSEVDYTRRKTTSGDALSSNSSTLHHHRSKRPRLAVAVSIDMSEAMEPEMIIFCSEHMALLEQMIYRLRYAAENAYMNRQNFLQVQAIIF
jgi:IS30 family transposase